MTVPFILRLNNSAPSNPSKVIQLPSQQVESPGHKEECDLSPEYISNWRADWAWGLPLIVLTVMIHAAGLSLIKRLVDKVMPFIFRHQALSIGGITLSITLLHGFEAFLWGLAFLALKAVPDNMSATLYSLNALTAFGHIDLKLERPWQLLGAIEALNGWILFGLSSAYLFDLIQCIWMYARRSTPSQTRSESC